MHANLVLSVLLFTPAIAHAELPVVMGVQLGQVPPNHRSCTLALAPEEMPCYGFSVASDVRLLLSLGQPAFVTTFELHLANDGTVDGMDIGTHGVADQAAAYQTLAQKFGEPTKRVDGRAQNLYGASFDTISAFWVKPDYEVDFIGTTGDLTEGDIAVSTTALHDKVRRRIQSQQSPF